MGKTTIDIVALYRTLDSVRNEKGLSWRTLAKEIGVSPSLLSRLRNGLKPDTDSFATIVRWLGIPAERFFVGGAQEEVNPHDDDDLMRQFVPLLRAQKNLSEEDKQYLEQIVSVTLKHVRGKEK